MPPKPLRYGTLSLLAASGGAGKTTLLRSPSAEINASRHSKVMLIEADTLKSSRRTS
ncbi:zeta toxin family protein [Paraburkholderia piptadeniae]|uniref:zeta toxin family protein n=1 Tax=Paraburkholderia piptadeniae TaxID=1701573 RepID=UPI0034DD5EAA